MSERTTTAKVRRLFAASVVGAALALAAVGAAGAHGLTVDPPPQDPVVSGPVSKGWAQAHCNAAAPVEATANSNGVVTFSPAAALACPPVANPGGQVHP